MRWNFRSRKSHNLVLFSLSILYIFILGILDGLANMHFVYYTVISLIIFVSIFTVSESSGKTFIYPLIVVIATWVSEILHLQFLSLITGYLSVLFFLVIIVFLIIRIAKSKTVGALEFLESVNIYLLLGIAASVLFGVTYTFDHDAYHPPGETLNNQADFIYYAFVTMTTLGYGDIYPLKPLARSLSIFFSVSGQLYLALIIAMLVGKYLGQQQESRSEEPE